MSEAVKVIVRCRPLSTSQKNRGNYSIVQTDEVNQQIILTNPKEKQANKSFAYDQVFSIHSQQSFVYQQVAFQIVDSVVDGFNGTIFAYGQTGCGKTHTMMGDPSTQQGKGIIPRTFSHILTTTTANTNKKHLVRVKFTIFYVKDLLAATVGTSLQLKQNPDTGVYVKNLGIHVAKHVQDMEKLMQIGFNRRAVGQTAMNAKSSRSHSIFTVYVQVSQTDDLGVQKIKAGKLSLVDLAGSQRQSKTNAEGSRLKQATKINLSLSALGNVISALVDGKTSHIPYRDSKLTRLLQDSLGGNSKTLMMAAISPADYNYSQTLSTLRYASRAKFIKNKPKINQDPKDAMLRQYQQQIKKLKQMLQGKLPMASLISQESSQSYQIINQSASPSNQGAVLQQKQRQLLRQKLQKEQLMKQLSNLQQTIGKDAQQPKVDQKQLQKYKKLKQKLKAKKKKQQQLKRIGQQKQRQLLNIQQNYKSLAQQVQAMRSRFGAIKKKYVQALNQLKDLQQQHQQEKQDLFDTIRQQDKQVKFMSRLVEIMMTKDQMDTIRAVSQWDDQSKDYKIPLFCVKDKKVNFPKLKSTQLKDYIESQKNKKEIAFQNQRYQSQKLELDDTRKVSESYQSTSTSRSIRQDARLRLSNMSVDKYQQKKTFNIKLQQLAPTTNRDRTRGSLVIDQKFNKIPSKLQPILMGPPAYRKP